MNYKEFLIKNNNYDRCKNLIALHKEIDITNEEIDIAFEEHIVYIKETKQFHIEDKYTDGFRFSGHWDVLTDRRSIIMWAAWYLLRDYMIEIGYIEEIKYKTYGFTENGEI